MAMSKLAALFDAAVVALASIGLALVFIFATRNVHPMSPPDEVAEIEQPAIEFNDVREIELAAEELECLALAVYHESRNQPILGQMATASVVLNRAKSSGFPDQICGVIKDGGSVAPCQFSWYCDGKPDTPYEIAPWRTAKAVAEFVLDHREVDMLNGADHFHDTSIDPPGWASRMTRVARIGDTIYYASRRQDGS
jgi:spore germination cell wall hydrolase CwlJ-like protein